MNNYWWVNQNQTFKQEFEGGYLWSPKRKANGHKNSFYEFMRAVQPGDLVFSFSDTHIKAIGIAQSTAYGFPKPEEFGRAGGYWAEFGWRVDVSYTLLKNSIRPVDQIDKIGPLLPPRYSPLQHSGRGNQGVYLTKVPDPLANLLIGLIGEEAIQLRDFMLRVADVTVASIVEPIEGILRMEEKQVAGIYLDGSLSNTEKEQVIVSRRGQGRFRNNVAKIESKCRITEVTRSEHLIASHIKPWRYCDSADERLEGTNGLMLTPSADHLFDRGFISFEDSGEVIIAPGADQDSLGKMGIERDRYLRRPFNVDQKFFLDYHRREVLLRADVGDLPL